MILKLRLLLNGGNILIVLLQTEMRKTSLGDEGWRSPLSPKGRQQSDPSTQNYITVMQC